MRRAVLPATVQCRNRNGPDALRIEARISYEFALRFDQRPDGRR